MQKVVGVRFKKAGKIYYFDPDELDLQLGDGVIVETARGIEFGYLVVGPKLVSEEDIVTPLKKVIRKADDSDYKKVEENEKKAKEAFQIGLEKIAKHGLPMKLVNVEITFDNKKIIFYFTAEGRVDFRELVKDLASVFRTRIELRQIGVRDEAKMIGGLGLCGRPVCCKTFLGEFQPVSIRMAKDQNLSLNPTKISGLCGRLMCCLQYEADTYKDALAQLPNVGDVIDTPQGKGKVTEVNPLTGEVNVQVEEGVEIVLNLGDNTPDCDTCAQHCPVRKQVTVDKCPLVAEANPESSQEASEAPEVHVFETKEQEKEEDAPQKGENGKDNEKDDKGKSKGKKSKRRKRRKSKKNSQSKDKNREKGKSKDKEKSKEKNTGSNSDGNKSRKKSSKNKRRKSKRSKTGDDENKF
ncbi:MAG: stage 0 sporulation family protein [Firmicutes bacterium]|nr:stage 0 sporulation family protein [Bacillota bacterium]